MGLLQLLPKSPLGFRGAKPDFFVSPIPPGSLHNVYSIDGVPIVKWVSSNTRAKIPPPSRLDEGDTLNKSKYKSKPGQRYMDNLPK